MLIDVSKYTMVQIVCALNEVEATAYSISNGVLTASPAVKDRLVAARFDVAEIKSPLYDAGTALRRVA